MAAPPKRPLDHLLVDAAEARTRRLRGPGTCVVKVVLHLSDGGTDTLDVPPELRAAARRSREELEAREQADQVSLTQAERNCLIALAEADEPMTGDEVAVKAGYEPGSKVRTALASLVRKGCVGKKAGYVITALGRAAVGVGKTERVKS